MKSTIRNAAKLTISNILFHSGACTFLSRLSRNNLTILTYHSFAPENPDQIMCSLPAHEFDRQLSYLKLHYDVVSLSRGLDALRKGCCEKLGKKPLLSITIDDGYADNHEIAYPILRKHGVSATLFVSTDFVDNRRPPWPSRLREILMKTGKDRVLWPFDLRLNSTSLKDQALKLLKNYLGKHPSNTRFEILDKIAREFEVSSNSEICPLTWRQICSLRDDGWDIGSHTVYHSMLPYADKASTFEELLVSKARIEEELHEKCSLFSYPDGGWDHKSKSSALETGYKVAVTQDWGVNKSTVDPFTLRRIQIPYYENLPVFLCRVTRTLRPFH